MAATFEQLFSHLGKEFPAHSAAEVREVLLEADWNLDEARHKLSAIDTSSASQIQRLFPVCSPPRVRLQRHDSAPKLQTLFDHPGYEHTAITVPQSPGHSSPVQLRVMHLHGQYCNTSDLIVSSPL